MKIVLIGAGSANFGLGTIGDILKSDVLAGSQIVLHDIDPVALEQVTSASQRFVQDKNLPASIEGALSRKEAVRNADFIMISIEVGDRFAFWEQDWHIPVELGVKQVYGENGGPGGLFHALRIIPPILEICEDIQTLSPNATVFNFSNPMTKICHAVHARFPQLKFIGLCHEVASLVEHLPKLLGLPLSDLHFRAGGMNHFSILVEATYRDSGRDAYPDILSKGMNYFADAPGSMGVEGERSLFLEIMRRLSVLPITTDSHIGEYISWAWDVADHAGIKAFYNRYKNKMLSYKELPVERLERGMDEADFWRVVPMIEGILTDSNQKELSVNIPNDGFIPALPANQVVEVPAVVDGEGIHGVGFDVYPEAFADLLLLQVPLHDRLTEAILSKSRDAVIEALFLDPVVEAGQPMAELLDRIVELQAPYLDYLH